VYISVIVDFTYILILMETWGSCRWC